MKTFRTLPAVVVALVVAASLPPCAASADEGQWSPEQLAEFDPTAWEALRARGLAFSPAQLWDGKGGGLLIASVEIGGCSGAFVSADGLIATNHHCAFDALQLASTADRNFLENGFVAKDRAGEVEARGRAARVLVPKRIVDVTDRVRGAKSAYARAKDDLERYEAVELASKEIVAECEKSGVSRCRVASFYDGLFFRLQEQTELKDVRLVYAPPRAVGEYGGEIDNFRWPRHTGDFSFFRAYVAPDGKAALHAAGNVPYRPAAFFPVSSRGVAEGDLVMVTGYPGRTNRYLSASAVKNFEEWFYPLRSRTYIDLIAALEHASASAAKAGDKEAPLRVANAIKSYANQETNARGQIEGLRRNGVLARVRTEESALSDYLAASKQAPSEWKTALTQLEAALAEDRQGQERRFYLEEIERAGGLLNSALTSVRWAQERAKPDLSRDAGFQDRDVERARQKEKEVTRSLTPVPQRRVLALLISRSLASGPSLALVQAFGAGATAEAVEKKLAAMDEGTRLAGEEVRLANLPAPLETLSRSEDPYLKLATALAPELAAIRKKRKETAGAMLRLRPAYLSALRAYRKSLGRPVYPDANSTLRMSFAEVKGYAPREATLFLPQTSTKGLLAKETGIEPFATPAKVRDAVTRGDFGAWGDPQLGGVPICFLSNADTTGGNSGSPTLNGKGELVGLNFDRVWENVAGDFGWSPIVSRNVSADIRYALWMMDRVDGAENLLRELLPAR
ncbi:MAG: S46 family peptidase [Thermoanaerobaculia bacterium]